jgi:hypothetical protein
MIADLAAEDPLAAYRSSFYRIDGSLQLRRSRFLHLFLDLEIREKKPELLVEPDFFGSIDTQTEPGNSDQDNIQRGVFALKQNRQIRTN